MPLVLLLERTLPMETVDTVKPGECPRCVELEKLFDGLYCTWDAGPIGTASLARYVALGQEVIRVLPVGIFVCQYQPPGELFCLCANSEALRLTGVDYQSFPGAEFDEVWSDARRLGLTDALINSIRTGKSLPAGTAYFRNGNSYRVLTLRAVPLTGNRVCVAFEECAERENRDQAVQRSAPPSAYCSPTDVERLLSRIRELEEEVARLKSVGE